MNIKQIVKRVCAWCQKDLGTKEMIVPETMIPPLREMVTHTICEPCREKVTQEVVGVTGSMPS